MTVSGVSLCESVVHRVALRPALIALRLAVIAAVAAMAPVPAVAQTGVDLQLVLAVDASGSVNHTRFELQKQG